MSDKEQAVMKVVGRDIDDMHSKLDDLVDRIQKKGWYAISLSVVAHSTSSSVSYTAFVLMQKAKG